MAQLIPVHERDPGQSRYGALAAALRARVISGEWTPGTALPSEQMLAAEHSVALGTMRRALDLLAQQGLVDRVHGRGTFVRAGLQGAPMARFFRFGEHAGDVPTSRILSRQVAVAPSEPAQALGIAKGERVLRLKRLRSFDGQPGLLEDIWLPLPAFDALLHSDPAQWGDLLYPVFAERCGVRVHRAMDAIRFDTISAAQGNWLRLAAGHPCARVTRTAFDMAGHCVEYRITLGDAYAFRYTVAIT